MSAPRITEAAKAGLAMTSAYGIALYLDWDKPYWAGFAVSMMSMSTIGQSFDKAVLRMLGTLVATAFALIMLGLFPQDRWFFIFFLSIYVSFCTYMMGGTKHGYFWYVCGFVCVVVCMSAGPNSINAFKTALLRAQETGLGILVYSVISLILWPLSSQKDFEVAARKLADTQLELYRSFLDVLGDRGKRGDDQELRTQVVQEQAMFSQLLDAAETDSYEVREVRQQWKRYRAQTMQLTENMERWRASLVEVQALKLSLLLPNITALGVELEERLVQIGRMLADQHPERYPATIELTLDRAEVQQLSHFHKAALAVIQSRVQQLEQVTRSMFDCLYDIKGFGQSASGTNIYPQQEGGFALDPDRLACAVRVMLILWLAFCAVIYVEGMPGGPGFVRMAAAFGMAMAATPQLPISLLFLPAAMSVSLAGVIYLLVMPQLSSFLGLGVLIFAYTSAICYIFATPRQALCRGLGLAMFVMIASISNEQTYSFLKVANTGLMFVLLFLLLYITTHLPFSLRPQRVFLRLLGRYFRSCGYLITTMRWNLEREVRPFDRWREAYHRHEVSTLPRKLGGWMPHIDPYVLTGASKEQMQTLVTSMQGLTYRLLELLEECGKPQEQFLRKELQAEVKAWRIATQKTFQGLAKDPGAGDREVFRTKLDGILDHLEERIKIALEKAPSGQLTDWHGENFYRLLGAYRGMSEALVNYSESAGVINWALWHEERF